MKNAGGLWFGVALALVGLVFWFVYMMYFAESVPEFLVENADKTGTSLIFIVYGYVTMLVGVALSAMYGELKRLRGKGQTSVRIGKVAASAFRSIDFWLGLFASPVVYVILLQAMDLNDLTMTGVLAVTLVGLQNGFLCNAIADTLIGGQTTAAPDKAG